MAMTHDLGPRALSDRNVEGETFESPRSIHLLPSPASAQLPLFHFETGSVLDVSVAGSNPEHLPHESTVYDYAYGDSDGYRYHREVSASTRGHGHTRVWGYPLSLALSPPQPNEEYGALDRPPPRFRVCGRIYTDDARMKLGECIRRQCFNCGATETRTWRRSKLTLGKLVCNKCGLFERAHAIPRPKSFSPRRRSRPASVHESRNPYPDIGGRHHNGTHSTMPFTGSPQSALNSGEGGEITVTSQDATSWMMHNMADVSSVPTPVIPGHTDISTPTTHLADFQLPSPHILHDQHALSHYPGHCFHPMYHPM